ncbi:MAG: FG-GAP-like repeat-containing protein [Chloroflexota bacterium]
MNAVPNTLLRRFTSFIGLVGLCLAPRASAASANQLLASPPDISHIILEKRADWNPLPVFTKGFTWGDVDGDGDLDLAVGNYEAANQLYLNDGAGNLTDSGWSPVITNTYAIAWGDVDGDGDLDLAVANGYSRYNIPSSNQLYLNDGHGNLTDSGWTPPPNNSKGIAWGDVDGDGDLDLAAANGCDPNMNNCLSNQLYLNDGHGNLTDSGWTPDAQNSYTVVWGDVDGDGDLDLAVGNYAKRNQLYLNDGGNLIDSGWAPDPCDTSVVAWGDVDGDGDLDLAVGNDSESNQLYRNEGGNLVEDSSWAPPGQATATLAWGDVDRDGDLDLVVGNFMNPNHIYLNQNGTLSSNPAWTADTPAATYSVAWGDIDGDGDLDLAVGNVGSRNQLYINKTFGMALSDWQPDTVYTESIDWGDIDGDYDLDLIVGNDGYPNQIYRNDGSNGMTLLPWVPAPNYTKDVAWGDVDGDGDLDLAIGNFDQPNQLYLNQSGILQNTPVWTAAVGYLTYSVAWGDADGDGDLDLAVGNHAQPNQLYLNDGYGNLILSPWTPIPCNTKSVTWGDVDGDGDLDLAVGNFEQSNQLYLNDGSGGLTLSPWAPVTNSTYSVAWGDVDGDTDLDLAVGNYGQPNQVYLNNGSGGLTLSSWTPGSRYTYSVAWGDVDQDTDLDLAVGNYGQPNQVYLNNGSGSLTLSSWTPLPNDTKSVAWKDLNGDGFPELTMGNSGAPNQIYLNALGALQNTPLWSSNPEHLSLSTAWGDADGDGDLDLAVGNYLSPNQLYLNMGGRLVFSGWVPYPSTTKSIAWGDADGDGDLDLAVGNYFDLASNPQPNQLYLNDGHGNLSLSPWSPVPNGTASLAWGDVDGDGDLDLAVGNYGALNQLYLNDGSGGLTLSSWLPGANYTQSIAWGDVDGDGDLDLVAGNGCSPGGATCPPTQLYLNNNGILDNTPTWTTAGGYDTSSVAWGDVDGDGDLDLAIGYFTAAVQLYLNSDGALQTDPAWVAPYSYTTQSIAWGDADGDGDLDLAVGNRAVTASLPLNNQIYLNENGVLQISTWNPPGNNTWSVAWGDVDGDGDLDLAVGNSTRASDTTYYLAYNQLYLNPGPANPLYPQQNPEQAGLSFANSPANGYATTHIWSQGIIPFVYTLAISGGAPQNISAEYSLDGGGQWHSAVATSDTQTQTLTTLHESALSFDGSNDYVEIPDAPGLQPAIFTIEAWIKADAWQMEYWQGVIVSKDSWDTNTRGYVLRAGEHGRLSFIMGCSSGWAEALSAPLMQTGVWYHVAGVFDGFSLVALINGQPVDVAICPSPVTSTQPLRIGSASFVTDRLFDGDIDEVRLWNVARSPAQIQADMDREIDGSTPGLEGYWRFDEGRGAVTADQTANHHDGTLTNGPEWIWRNPPTTYLYKWDTFASGFYGQSDNVVFRIKASPVITPTVNGKTPVFQRPYVSAASLPLRVRGNQVRVMHAGSPAQGAQVFHIPVGESQGSPYGPSAEQPYQTNNLGYLVGHGEMQSKDGLVALWPAEITDAYTLYYTSAAPSTSGLDVYTITQNGVQTLTVSADNPLLVFNLNVSLEWDARYDPFYLETLRYNFRRASEIMYDWSNGQATLGKITIYHDRQHWTDADIRIYATNRLRPNAVQGGITLAKIPDPDIPSLEYAPGQLYMSPVWNRYGGTGSSQSDDWARTLVHELGHYAFYLNDNYLGLDSAGRLIPISTCWGSMADPYRIDAPYDEFHPAADWLPSCEQTLSNRSAGRSDWQTISRFYPLFGPGDTRPVNLGPTALPLQITQIKYVDPATPDTSLVDPTFYLTADGASFSPGAGTRAILYRGDWATDLGSPTLDQVLARGARPGDRLCIYAPSNERAGCETIQENTTQIELPALANWQPFIDVIPVSSTQFTVTVSNLPAGLSLSARLYPADVPAPPAQSMTPVAGQPGSYTVAFNPASHALSGIVQVWVDGSAPLQEAITDYALGGNPAPHGSGSGDRGNAPAASSDGQVILYGDVIFDPQTFYTLQAITRLPADLPWATQVGLPYRLTASAGAPDLTLTSIGISYLSQDAPPGEEQWISMYYWNGIRWRILPTTLDTYQNTASASTQGPGVYVLMSSYPIPLSPGWNLFAYPVSGSRSVTETLASIAGNYGPVYSYNPAYGADPWKLYSPTVPGWVNDLSTFTFGSGYWISVTQNITTSYGITLYIKGAASTLLRPTSGFPVPPATYYGTLSGDPSFAPGQALSAWVGSQLCGSGQAFSAENSLVYVLDVFSILQMPGCGLPGQEIHFRAGSQIGDRLLLPAGRWLDGQPWRLDLSAIIYYFPFIPKH